VTATDTLSTTQFVEPIRASEARGNSRAVTPAEYQHLAGEGHAYIQHLADQAKPTKGLDRHWDEIKSSAYQATREPWGGVTVNAHTGRAVSSRANVYAITARHPGQDQISIPGHANEAEFGAAMDRAREAYPQLAHKGHHLGVFRDDDEGGRIDIDPTVIVNSRAKVEAVGAYTRAVGGAYHFRSGNGSFPPHVKD
jgi:hypothetical protein